MRRFRRGERFLGWQLGVFDVALLFAIEEVPVANRILNFPSLLDFGFLLLVMPFSWQIVCRVINRCTEVARAVGTPGNRGATPD